MSYSKLILRDSADIVWPFDDLTESASISRAINFFNQNIDSYSASINPAETNVIFNPMVFGGGYSLSLTSSAIGFSIPALDRFSELYNSKESVFSFWFKSSQLFNVEHPIFKKRNYENIGLFIKDNYLIFRYGTSASYNEVAGDLENPDEPNHILISKNESGLLIMINGVAFTSNNETPILDKDNSHNNNNYLDFYGPPSGYWQVDAVAVYPNTLSPNDAKRHYVYGLGKNIGDSIFYSRGGNLYNFYTSSTERLADIDWRYPQEWKITSITDLIHETDGIKPLKYINPTFFNSDNNIQTASNVIKFSSSSVTQGSYIQIDKIEDKIDGGEKPFFVKVKLNGDLPPPYLSQRIVSYGIFPQYEILKFDLYNDNNNYQIKISSTQTTASLAFNINNIESNPSIYVGMNFKENSTFYFAESGSVIQSASFSYYSASGFGLDPMIPFFPPPPTSVIRIGSSLNYNNENFTDNVSGVEQFYGSFERFLITQSDFVSSSATFDDLENYKKPRYEFIYDSYLERFKTKTYGYGEFYLHSINFAESISDTNQKIGGNVIRVGYPEVNSASQVMFYATFMNYSGSVVQSKFKLDQTNYLGFLNNTNLYETYLKFDFEIYAEDSIYYPPKIKYFNMETFREKDGKVVLRDDAGSPYTLTPSSSSVVYLPESRYTPSIFMTDYSGLKINNNSVIFTENIAPKPLDPRSIPGLKLWLDSRFVNGLNNVNPNDDSRITIWKDLSNNSNAIQNTASSAPVFRVQSANLLLSNQLSGGENDDISKINAINVFLESSSEGAVTGNRGLKLTPNGSSIDSYIEVLNNTASISVFPNQKYNVFASIKLTKPQTGSALSSYARGFILKTGSAVADIISASAFAINSAGTYTLSAQFTTGINDTKASLQLYNGSYDPKDFVYWDNIGIYQHEQSSSVSSWFIPLTQKDYPSIKFNGIDTSILTAASVSGHFTIYLAGKILNDGVFFGSPSANFYVNSGSFNINFGTNSLYTSSNNDFNIYSLIIENSNAKLYINSNYAGDFNIGSNSLSNIIIGSGLINGQNKYLSGEIGSFLIYDTNHNDDIRYKVENWLLETFNIE